MNEYRCTRFRPYAAEGCLGYDDPSQRNGDYIVAADEFDALIIMSKKYDDDARWAKAKGVVPFTVELWRESVCPPRLVHL